MNACVDDLSNGRAGLFKCTSEGNTPSHMKSINSTDFLPLFQLVRDPSRSRRLHASYLPSTPPQYPSIPEAISRSITNNLLQPIDIMKLSLEFLEEKTNRAEDKDFDSADIRGVNHLLRCFTIYRSILCCTVPLAVQTPLISAFLGYIDRFFGYTGTHF